MKGLLTTTFLLLAVVSLGQRYVLEKDNLINAEIVKQLNILYLPISDKELAESKLLDSCFTLLKANSGRRLNKYLKACKKQGANGSDFNLIMAFRLLNEGKPNEALDFFQNCRAADYPVLYEMLRLDIQYGTSLYSGLIPYDTFLVAYQNLVDTNQDKKIIAVLAEARLRIIRYEM